LIFEGRSSVLWVTVPERSFLVKNRGGEEGRADPPILPSSSRHVSFKSFSRVYLRVFEAPDLLSARMSLIVSLIGKNFLHSAIPMNFHAELVRCPAAHHSSTNYNHIKRVGYTPHPCRSPVGDIIPSCKHSIEGRSLPDTLASQARADEASASVSSTSS
jgi:hypothetical protein